MRPARTTTARARFEDLDVQWPCDRPLRSQPQDQKHELPVRTMATFQPDRVMPTPPYHSALIGYAHTSILPARVTGSFNALASVSLRTLAGMRAPSSTASTGNSHPHLRARTPPPCPEAWESRQALYLQRLRLTFCDRTTALLPVPDGAPLSAQSFDLDDQALICSNIYPSSSAPFLSSFRVCLCRCDDRHACQVTSLPCIRVWPVGLATDDVSRG